MIITCPSCSVKFSVAEEAIPPQGRKLKCSQCEFLWHYKPARPKEEAAAPVTERERPLRAKPPSSPMPRHVRINAPLWMTGIAALIVIAAGGIAGMTWFPGAFGFPSSEGLTLADVALKPAPAKEDGKPGGYAFEGSIVNTTQEARRAPKVRLVLTDKGGKAVKSWNVTPDASVIAPGGRLKFSGGVDAAQAEGMKLRLDVGNPLELLLRRLK